MIGTDIGMKHKTIKNPRFEKMTATAQVTRRPLPVIPVRMVDGGRMMVRAAQRLIGVAILLAVGGLWLLPSGGWEADVVLFKLVLSLTGVLAGLCLLQASAAPDAPQIELDVENRELRLVRKLAGGRTVVLRSCRFGNLSHAERRGAHLRLWDETDRLIAELTLADRDALRAVVAVLRDEGKLV